MPALPKISIITPSYNQASFLEETILSVQNQRYPNLEHIVIDGGSTDGSVEIIKRHEKNLAYWVSEKDAGQSQAINKGISRATGDILAFINSDDVYLPGALTAVAEHFTAHPDHQWIAGGWVYFAPAEVQNYSAPWGLPFVPFDAMSWLCRYYEAAQQSMFWKRDLFTQHGLFDEKLHYAFDFEFFIRLLSRGIECHALNRPLAGFRIHGESKSTTAAAKWGPELDKIKQTYLSSIPRSRTRKERKISELAHCRERYKETGTLLDSGRRKEAWRRFLGAIRRAPSSVTTPIGMHTAWRLLRSA